MSATPTNLKRLILAAALLLAGAAFAHDRETAELERHFERLNREADERTAEAMRELNDRYRHDQYMEELRRQNRLIEEQRRERRHERRAR